MAIQILNVKSYASSPTFQGQTLIDFFNGFIEPFAANGDTDPGICLQMSGDGKDITDTVTGGVPECVWYFNDNSSIPLAAVINSVQYTLTAKGTDVAFFGGGIFTANLGETDIPITSGSIGPAYSVQTSDVMLVNPGTGLAWARADLFSDGDVGSFGNGAWSIRTQQLAGSATIGFDYVTLIVNYTAAATWYYNSTSNHYQYSPTDPGPPWAPATPTLTVDSITPEQGSTAGGNAATIHGTGFGDGATVVIGGNSAIIVALDANHITITVPAHVAGTVSLTVTNPDGGNATLSNCYTYVPPEAAQWWQLETPVEFAEEGFNLFDFEIFDFFVYSLGPPDDFVLPFDISGEGFFIPAGTVFGWGASFNPPPNDKGWWLSFGDDFAGAAFIVTNSRPKDSRSFREITDFANGSAGTMGGFPGSAAIWENRLIYAPGGYVVGTDFPTLRIFDGTFDREITTLPKTSGGVIPKAVLSILVADGTIYVSTFDSGTNSSNYAGRVFQLDIETGDLTAVGAAFSGLPYALAFHNGRLWCGTNKKDPTVSGSVYFFRPLIDTAWTADHALSSDGQGGVCSLLSYKGLLYVGCSAASGSAAKVLVRGVDNAYTTSDTGSGGTLRENNAYLALAEYGGKLYASYFNPDTVPVSKIRVFDNTSWSTSYTGTGQTNVPFLGFPTDETTILGIGGGVGYQAALVGSVDGVNWTDRTAFLTQGAPPATCVPAFGVVVR